MAKIADVNKEGKSEILVSGHTDNKPLTFGSIYRDKWDLAAARSSSVIQELTGSGKLNPKRMKAISYGETQPVESNATSKGREKNRRIEIEINYQKIMLLEKSSFHISKTSIQPNASLDKTQKSKSRSSKTKNQ